MNLQTSKNGIAMLWCLPLLLTACSSNTRQVSEDEYAEFQKWKTDNSQMAISMAPPPTPGPYYQPIDSTTAHCMIKNFYDDKNMYLRVMTEDNTYTELKSFHFDKASILSLVGNGPSQGNMDGIRFYFGESFVDSLPVHSIIMVGTTISGTYKDGVTMYNNVKTPMYADYMSPCPNRCSNDPAMTGEDRPLIFEYTRCSTNQ
jgi:hypothetical protein